MKKKTRTLTGVIKVKFPVYRIKLPTFHFIFEFLLCFCTRIRKKQASSFQSWCLINAEKYSLSALFCFAKLNHKCFIKLQKEEKNWMINPGRLTRPSRDLFCFKVDAGNAVPLGFTGALLAVSCRQLLCCCGNTNKICCFGLTQFGVINNNKNSYLPWKK